MGRIETDSSLHCRNISGNADFRNHLPSMKIKLFTTGNDVLAFNGKQSLNLVFKNPVVESSKPI